MKLKFRSTGRGFRDKGPFFKISIFGHETWPLAKVPEVAHTCMLSFYHKGSKWGIFSLYGQRFPRYGPIFKIAWFRYQTWPLTKDSEVACIFALRTAVSKICADFQNCHTWAWNLPTGKSSETAHTLSFYPRGSTPEGWNWAYICSTDSSFWDTGRFSKLPYLDIKLGH